MGIISRAEALLASNFNALIARFEEPGRDIAYLLGQMKDQIHAAQRDLIRVLGERKRSEAGLSEVEAEIEKWQTRAELAVRKGDDALAREALAQKQRIILQREALTQTRAEAHRAALAMKSEIERMTAIHRDFSTRQGTIATVVSQSRAGGGAVGLGGTPGESNFDAFQRIEDAIESAESEVTAQVEIEQMLDQTALGTMSRRELDDRFRSLEQQPISEQTETSSTSAEHGENPKPAPRIRIES